VREGTLQSLSSKLSLVAVIAIFSFSLALDISGGAKSTRIRAAGILRRRIIYNYEFPSNSGLANSFSLQSLISLLVDFTALGDCLRQHSARASQDFQFCGRTNLWKPKVTAYYRMRCLSVSSTKPRNLPFAVVWLQDLLVEFNLNLMIKLPGRAPVKHDTTSRVERLCFD
jgi:hypothetical protein